MKDEKEILISIVDYYTRADATRRRRTEKKLQTPPPRQPPTNVTKGQTKQATFVFSSSNHYLPLLLGIFGSLVNHLVAKALLLAVVRGRRRRAVPTATRTVLAAATRAISAAPRAVLVVLY